MAQRLNKIKIRSNIKSYNRKIEQKQKIKNQPLFIHLRNMNYLKPILSKFSLTVSTQFKTFSNLRPKQPPLAIDVAILRPWHFSWHFSDVNNSHSSFSIVPDPHPINLVTFKVIFKASLKGLSQDCSKLKASSSFHLEFERRVGKYDLPFTN